MGFNCLRATERLRRGSLLFTTKFPEITGTRFIDLGRMKGWVDFGVTKWFSKRDPWIGNPAPLLTGIGLKCIDQKNQKLAKSQDSTMKTPSKSLHLRCLSGLLYKLTFWDFWSFFCHFTMFQNNYKGLRNSLALLFCINFHWFPVWNISQKIKWKYDLIYNPSNISVKYHPIDSINWMTMKQHVHKMMNSTLYNINTEQ